jgi:hypothetical protein
VWKELPNGEAEWWLAGDEQVVVLTSMKGKKTAMGKISPAIASFYRGRRERGSGRVPQVGVVRRRQAGPVSVGARRVPLLGSLIGGPAIGI